MSINILNQVWEADLARPMAWVLMAYADHADYFGRNVHPSIELVAWKTGYSPRQVQRITRDLEDAGILVRQGITKYGPVLWDIDMSKVPKKPEMIRSDPANMEGDILSGVTPRAEKHDKMSPKSSNHHKESIIKKGMTVMESCGAETEELSQPQTPPEKALTAASQVFYAQLDKAHTNVYRRPYAGPRVELAGDPDLVVLISWSVGDIALLLADALAIHHLQISQPMDTWPSYKLAITQVLGERAKAIEERTKVGMFTANLIEAMKRNRLQVEAIEWATAAKASILAAMAAGIPTDADTLDYAVEQWLTYHEEEPFVPTKQLNWLIKVANNRAVQVLKSSGRNGQNGATSNARNGNGRATANRNGSNGSTPRQQHLSLEQWQQVYEEHERHMRGDD